MSLDTQPYFETLSYVWGDPKVTNVVKIDEFEADVTKNLEAALRQLRKKTEKRVIWVDQLCINQIMLHEKSQQVSLMPEIYKHCSEVFLWLGEDGSGGECAIEESVYSQQ